MKRPRESTKSPATKRCSRTMSFIGRQRSQASSNPLCCRFASHQLPHKEGTPTRRPLETWCGHHKEARPMMAHHHTLGPSRRHHHLQGTRKHPTTWPRALAHCQVAQGGGATWGPLSPTLKKTATVQKARKDRVALLVPGRSLGRPGHHRHEERAHAHHWRTESIQTSWVKPTP